MTLVLAGAADVEAEGSAPTLDCMGPGTAPPGCEEVRWEDAGEWGLVAPVLLPECQSVLSPWTAMPAFEI